jgi:hypothetical protein
MASTINADNGVSSGSAGLKESADSSGVLALQTNGTTAVSIDTSQNTTLAGTLTIGTATQAVPSGTAPLYAARAWVNFNGTGTIAIRASGNVSSITDNGVGDYTVNFTTAMTDANYVSVSGLTSDGSTSTANPRVAEMVNTSSSAMRMLCMDTALGTAGDMQSVYVAIFR